MEPAPLISVIVPIYNVSPYLDRCVGSILAQTYDRLEVILVDDGSTDGSGLLCDRWAARDPRVRILHLENGGAGRARNAGLALAQGALIGFVDGDDYIAPQMYDTLYALMEPQVDIAECAIAITEEDDFPLGGGGKTQTVSVQEAMKLHIQDRLFRQTPPNKLYRRETIGSIRFPEGNLIDDEFFTYLVIGNARRLAHTEERLYAYRQRGGSAMHKPFSLRRLQGLDAQVQRLDYVRRRFPELADMARRELFYTCLIFTQTCQRQLRGEERKTAQARILEIARPLKPLPRDSEAGGKRNALLWLAQRSLPAAGRMLNLLQDMGILT